jgi:dipeptidyl aminopeptidase/acylaminoacyl peptidase
MSPAGLFLSLALVTPQDLIAIADVGAGIPGGTSSAYDFDGISVSPNHAHIAVETRHADLQRNTTIIRWQVIDLDGEHRAVDVGDGGEPIPYTYKGLIGGYSPPQHPTWSPDSQWIVYRRKQNGQVQLWRSRRDGSLQEQLTHNAADVESYRWSEDGNTILFRVGEARESLLAGLALEGRRGFLYDHRFAPFYERAPIAEPGPSSEGTLWALEVDDEVERPATPDEKSEFARLSTGSSVPGRTNATWVRRALSSTVHVWLEDLRADRTAGLDPQLTLLAAGHRDSQDVRICRAQECTGHFKGLWISDDGRRVYFLRWKQADAYDSMAMYVWSLKFDKVEKVFETDDLIEACAKVGERIICAHESGTTPRKIVAIDLAKGRRSLVYDPNPSFQHFQLGRVIALAWKDRDGINGFGHLVLPPDHRPGQRHPLIVVQYRSRGFLRGGVGDEYPIHVFAANSFAVLSFDRPGDPELDRASASYDEAEQKGWVDHRDRRRVLSVLEAGIDHLARQGFIDPQRVGITGLSDGAETVGFALVNSPSRYAAAAASALFWDPITFYLAGPKYWPELASYGLRHPDDRSRRQWLGISVAMNAERIVTPLLLQVPDHEFMLQTEAFATLREHGRPVEMYVFPDEYHVKVKPLHRLHIYRRNLQWFLFWLQDTETDDPLDASQYERWRRLKAECQSQRPHLASCRNQISAVTQARSG